MPQMKPMNWVNLLILFLFSLMMFNCITYFFNNYNMPHKNTNNLKMYKFNNNLKW